MKLKVNSDPKVKVVLSAYEKQVREKLSKLRFLILETAADLELERLHETLKWGEPSYIAPKGSTIRIDWKQKNPDQYAIYFKCTSQLVPSFKMVFGDLFQYEKNRAIVFGLDQEIPELELKQCIAAALTYHKVKHLPLLGIKEV